jgi:hypothetical protein
MILRRKLFLSRPSIGAIFLLFLGSVCAASADCLSRCLGSCTGRYDTQYCRDVNNRCGGQCAGKGSHDYGAIAYSRRTGATGWSNKYDTRDEAESRALDECRARATDCEIEVWFDDTCGAVAAGDKGVSWGLGDTARKAQLAALEKCSNAGGTNCEVKESACSRGAAD